MSDVIEIKVPDIGDFEDVDVIEVYVSPGDSVNVEDPLISLESDKATMDVPSPSAGVVSEVKVAVGDKVSQGSLIVVLQGTAAEPPATTTNATSPASEKEKPLPTPVAAATSGDIQAEVLVLGSGPGGYTAAFRAADLGKKTVLVERYPKLGGVCLNVGCIPSKALLHAAKVIAETKEMREHGVEFGAPLIDLEKLDGWKNRVVNRLTDGLAGLAKQRKVTVVQGRGKFTTPNRVAVESADENITVSFDQAIIAAGSQAVQIPGFPNDDARLIDSTDALALSEIPKRLLIIGGGIIGLEIATVYYELGSSVTVVELMDSLMPGVDKDIVRPLHKRIARQYENIFLSTKVTDIKSQKDGLMVSYEGTKAPASELFDRVLVAVGRFPNGKVIGAENAGVQVDERGFIPVDKQQCTNVPHIFAIGDIVEGPMLAHKATHEGKVAAEVAAGMKSAFDAQVIPSVAYTDPEVAWIGTTESEAKEKKLKYGKGVFPWAASGRALGLGRDEGMTKLLFDEDSGRVIGAGIVGPNAGDLIAEVALAIEIGCDAQDIGLTIHPHPTLSESIAFAAEAFEGTITDLYMPRKKK